MKQDKRTRELFNSLLKGHKRLTWPVCWLFAVLLMMVVDVRANVSFEVVGSPNVADARLNIGADTLNYGGRNDAITFWSSGNVDQGGAIFGFNVTSVPDSLVIDSVIFDIKHDLKDTGPTTMDVGIIRSDWVQGNLDGVKSTSFVCWKWRGGGTAFNNVNIGTGPQNWTGGNVLNDAHFPGGVFNQIDINVTDTASHVKINVKNLGVADSLAAGVNFVSIILYDPSNSPTGTAKRARWRTTEYATNDAWHPRLIYYGKWPYQIVPPDSTWLRISVVPPSSPLSDYTVLVDFLTYPGTANTNLTFYASDSTTKLYWWPDSINGHYTRAWVMHDWSSNPDTIFVRRLSNSTYMKADSVFLLYDNFNQSFSVSQPITDFINWTGTTFDTNGIMLSPNGSGADSVIREPSGMIRDWQESDASKRWKWFYCGEKLSIASPNAYNDNFLLWAYSDQYTGTWTKVDTVMYDSSGVTQAVNAEDPDILWLPGINKWAMYLEDHDDSPTYHVSVLLADSLDQLVWIKRPIAVLDASALGTPTNWLNKEQASPTMCWNATRDTLLMFYEAFSNVGAGPSRMGLALSFSNGTGDTVGLDWYLTDSTGALNPTNPMPIVPWGITAQADSDKVIPDGAYYLNGKYCVFTHCTWRSKSHPIWYYGDSPRNLVYQGDDDSTHLGEVVIFDTASGDFLSVYQEDLTKSYIRARLRDFDSTRWADPKWKIHFRSDKNTTPNRFLCGEAYQSNGVLCMYPPQRQTGCVAIQSTSSFSPGFYIDIWSKVTSWTSVSNYTYLSIGDTVLQDASGVKTNEGANWSSPRVNTGYSLRLQTNAVSWLENNDGAAGSNPGGQTTVSVGSDTLTNSNHMRIYYTTGDSLVMWINGVKKCVALDATYHTNPMYLTIAQGEIAESDAGGLLRIDSIRVRKFTTADATAAASDTLYGVSEDNDLAARAWGRVDRPAWGRRMRGAWGR